MMLLHVWSLPMLAQCPSTPPGSFNSSAGLCLLPGDRHSAGHTVGAQFLLMDGQILPIYPSAYCWRDLSKCLPDAPPHFQSFHGSRLLHHQSSLPAGWAAQIWWADLSYSETLVACPGERDLHSLEKAKKSIGF